MTQGSGYRRAHCQWLHYADHGMEPIRRSVTSGAFLAKIPGSIRPQDLQAKLARDVIRNQNRISDEYESELRKAITTLGKADWPIRALGRMNTGGGVRHTSEPTIETTGRECGLLMAAALMRGNFLRPAHSPRHP